eukprot:COSAG03_NODE_98_length_13005_cov_17.216953_14_plen_164_part_00
MVRRRVAVAVIDQESIVVDAVLQAEAASGSTVTHCTSAGLGDGGEGGRDRDRQRGAVGWGDGTVTHEEVNHLVDGKGARAIVVQQRVQRLELHRQPGTPGHPVSNRRYRLSGEHATRTCCRLSSCSFPATIPAGTAGVAGIARAIPSIIAQITPRIIAPPPPK